MVWLEQAADMYDFAIVDLPDPSNFSLGKRNNVAVLSPAGTTAERERGVRAYKAHLLSSHVDRSGAWSARSRTQASRRLPITSTCRRLANGGSCWQPDRRTTVPRHCPTAFASSHKETLDALFEFPLDMTPVSVEVNRLHNQALVRYYENEWNAISR